MVRTRSNFDGMELSDPVLRGIYAYGLQAPAELQQRALVPLLRGHNCLVHGGAGTGKTTTYVISALQCIDTAVRDCQVIVITPTEELACGIASVFAALGEFLDVTSCALGASFYNPALGVREVTTRRHARGPRGRIWAEGGAVGAPSQVIVGTPSHVVQLLEEEGLREGGATPPCLDALRFFVVDEAEEMLTRDRQWSIRQLVARVGASVQTAVMFTGSGGADGGLGAAAAAQDDPVWAFVRDPVQLRFRACETLTPLVLGGVKQFYVATEREEWKLDTLLDLLRLSNAESYNDGEQKSCTGERMRTTAGSTSTPVQKGPAMAVVVYCNTLDKVDWLEEKMRQRRGDLDVGVSTMHGDMDMQERETVISDFLSGGCARVLIMTEEYGRLYRNVAPVVIQYDLPTNRENYIHRIGGITGNPGVAISFLNQDDVHILRDIEQLYNTQIDELPANVAELIGFLPGTTPTVEEPCGGGGGS